MEGFSSVRMYMNQETILEVKNRKMKSPIKLENHWHEHSRAERIIIIMVLFIVAVVMSSWVADGFASIGSDVLQGGHGVAKKSQEYNMVAPLHPDFCKGYDAALIFETSDQKAIGLAERWLLRCL
jgi:hypothetical protein